VTDAATAPLRIGTLGAARITPAALVKPARTVPEVEIVAVAARDHARAEKFARKHGITTIHDSYEALLADPSVQAVYNPLPNGLHGRWTIAALEAGKHVLCEKPFTANADEAEAVAAVAAEHPDLVVMEAFHYRFHPLVPALLDIIAGGELGTVRRIETRMCIPLPVRSDIRYQLDLAGGALMDVGCYAIHQLRTLASAGGAAGASGSAGAPDETPLAASTGGRRRR
jgi:predicted dehydrogenase